MSVRINQTVTLHEAALLEGISRGWTNALIAEDLGIAKQTVKNQIGRLCDKLGAKNRTDLPVFWIKPRRKKK